jgi:hypothetical protein
VLALSAPIHDDHGRRYCQIEEVEVMLINPQDWSYRRLAATPGANTRPFFSADGKTVYYFKGRKRERGATPASKFDLYAYELATDRETRLTFDEMYEVGPSHDDGKEILFSVYGHRRIPSFIPNSKREQRGLYALDKTSLQLRQFHIDQQEGFFNIQLRDKDITENVYILTLKRRPGGGNYLRVIYRCNAQGNHCVMLREIPAESGVHAAFQTGEVFINDAIGNEIVFRRLTEKARVQ